MNDPDAPAAHDEKWLVARERGEDVSHVPASERAAYERLGALLGSGVAPRAGFRQRVLAAIDATEQAERAAERTERAAHEAKVIPLAPRRRRWIAAAGLTAVAAAAAAMLVVLPGRHGAATGPVLALESKIRKGEEVLRGSADRDNQVSLGSTLVIRAQIQDGPAEVRVYGGTSSRLIASCKHPGTCVIESNGEDRWLVLQTKLQAPGKVHTVVFVGERIPASHGAYDPDIEAAQAAGVPHKHDETSWIVL